MPYIIDGHNLIGQMPHLSLETMDDEQQLIELLQDFCRRQQRTAEVYFDHAPPGMPRARNYGRLTAFFIRAGKSADQAIYERLQRLGREARNWTVVSSDRQVQTMAKAARARVISASAFARQLSQAAAAKESDLNEKSDYPEIDIQEFEEWLKPRSKNSSKDAS
ncbi:MAG: hypothetical protein DDG59_11240 [Anaerolineae bacterium]|jgi:predicted RNA-binding protein with PIN domain|nr:MAG: hypothetical protein DDG59_11240 [Anaerolineae bacterium]